MIFREPEVEFIELSGESIAAQTGAGYTVCERVNGNNISVEDYCAEMGANAMPWDDLCKTVQNDDTNYTP